MNNAEYLAMMFHKYCEELTPNFRDNPTTPWLQVPEEKKSVLIAVAEKLLNGHVQIIEKEAEEDKCLCLPTGPPYKYCPVHLGGEIG